MPDLISAGQHSHDVPSESSGFSVPGDDLPDEIPHTSTALMAARVESDAYVALKELGALVARRRGLNVEQFLHDLMLLLSGHGFIRNKDEVSLSRPKHDTSDRAAYETLPTRGLRSIRSQPLLSSDEVRRRHFSFEPGDDQLAAFEKTYVSQRPVSMAWWQPHSGADTPQSAPEADRRCSDAIATSGKLRRASKIPSPVSGIFMARVRREDSLSSLQSMVNNERRDSGASSVVTAIRQASDSSTRPLLASAGPRKSSGISREGGLRMRDHLVAKDAEPNARASSADTRGSTKRTDKTLRNGRQRDTLT